MSEILYQISHNGLAFCEPVGVEQKNAIVQALSGCTNVEVKPVVKVSPLELKVIEGGRKWL